MTKITLVCIMLIKAVFFGKGRKWSFHKYSYFFIIQSYLFLLLTVQNTPNPRFLRTLGPPNIGSAKIEGAKIKVIVM